MKDMLPSEPIDKQLAANLHRFSVLAIAGLTAPYPSPS